MVAKEQRKKNIQSSVTMDREFWGLLTHHFSKASVQMTLGRKTSADHSVEWQMQSVGQRQVQAHKEEEADIESRPTIIVQLWG